MKTCLNCLHEPDWGEWRGEEYRRQVGQCKFKLVLSGLPAVYRITKETIIRHSDDSGIKTNCKAWKPKQIIVK